MPSRHGAKSKGGFRTLGWDELSALKVPSDPCILARRDIALIRKRKRVLKSSLVASLRVFTTFIRLPKAHLPTTARESALES